MGDPDVASPAIGMAAPPRLRTSTVILLPALVAFVTVTGSLESSGRFYALGQMDAGVQPCDAHDKDPDFHHA